MDLFRSCDGSGKGRGISGFEGWGLAFGLCWFGLCRGLGASALGFSLSFGSLFRLGFFIPYGCALAHTRHARAHNSGTTDATDETDISYAFSHTRAVHTSSLRARTYVPTTSRREFQLGAVKVLVKAMIRLRQGKKSLMRKPHLASR